MSQAAAAARRSRSTRLALKLAIAASIATHAVAVIFIQESWQDLTPPPSVGRQRGAMAVSLTRASPSPLKSASPTFIRTSKPKATSVPSRPRKRTAAPQSAPPKAEKSLAVAPPARNTPAPAPHVKPGAQWASLFAPLVVAPIRSSTWKGGATNPKLEAASQQQREQQQMAFRLLLQDRLSQMAEAMRQAEHAISCNIAIDTNQKFAQVECLNKTDQAAPWRYLQGLLMPGAVSYADAQLCFQLTQHQVLSGPCPAGSAKAEH